MKFWNVKIDKVKSSKLAHNAVWMFLGQGLSYVFQATYFILLGRLLGSTEYGIYMGAVALAAIFSQYSALGSQWTFLQYVSPDHSQFSRYWGNILMATISLGALFTIFLTLVGLRIAHSYSPLMLLCVAAGDCLCMPLVNAIANVFQAFEKMRITAAMNILTNLLRVILASTLLVSLRHASAFQWAAAALIVSVCAVSVALVLVKWHFGKPTFSPSLLKKRSGEGLVYALSSSAGNVYTDFDKVLLGHFGMNSANGVYSMAYKAVSVFCMPIGSIHNAAFPRIFQRGKYGLAGTSAYVLRILKRTAPLSLLMAVILWFTAPILPHLLGPSFAESTSALRWLCLLPFTRAFQWSAGDALTGAGLQRYRLGTQIVAAVLNLSMNLYLIPRHGWLGAAWASVATDGTLAAMNWAVLLTLRGREQRTLA
jgi:O-antigen/teichoic acid export membrane protein